MILPVSSGFSAYSSYSPRSVGNSDGVGSFNFNRNPITLRREGQQHDPRGITVTTHPIPEALQWIAKKIQDRFGIEMKNSDISFSEEELKVIYYTLEQLPAGDLRGVAKIIKNRKLQLNMEDAPAGMFAKLHKNRVYGAYDKETKTIYIFDLDKPEQAYTVVKHEVGHAVHSHNIGFRDFFTFALKAGWDVGYHEQQFISGNSFYNMGMKTIRLSKEDAMETIQHFDWEALKKLKDNYGKYVLLPPDGKKDQYLYKNPFETFAIFYEKTH